MRKTYFSKKIQSFILFLIVVCLPFSVFAGIRSDRPGQLQYMTTTLGSGLSLGYNLGDHLLFGANYFGITLEGDGDNTANNETAKAEFSTTELMLRYYLFEGSGFYLKGAAVMRNWKFTVTGSDFIGDSGTIANYEMIAEWPTTGVSYGLGFNWIADFGLSGGIYLGMISGGEPELRGKVDNGAILQEDVDKEIAEIEEEEKFGEKYSNVPIIGAHIGFNF